MRCDSGVETGSVVSVHYDAMLAKLVAHAPTRAQACAVLADALARTQVHGVTTNRDLLVRVLRSPEFLAGEVDTGFLERHDAAVLGAPPEVPVHRLVAALAAAAERRRPRRRAAARAVRLAQRAERPAGRRPTTGWR